MWENYKLIHFPERKKSILWDTLVPAYLETCMLAKQHVHIERDGKNIEYGENKTK